MKLKIPVEQNQTKIPWSRYQEDIFHAAVHSKDNLLVQAVAGSGKTTTILECMNRTPNNKTCGFVAFNKSIADELSSKVPAHVTAKTLHSVGYGALKALGYKTWKTKTRIILQDLCKEMGLEDEILYELLPPTRRVIGMLKSHIINEAVDIRTVLETAEELGFPLSAEQARIILIVWDRNHKGKYEKVIDFDDMLRTTVLVEGLVPMYDILYVDEAQDLNRIQHKLVAMMLAPNGRIIAVGDRHQAIYGFRGASSTSMDDLSIVFNMKEMPLSVSYRCSKLITYEAQKFNPDIQYRDGAPLGVRHSMEKTELYKYAFHLDESNMVLGRYNFSLFQTALRMRLYDQPVYLMGKDIVPMVLGTAKRIRKKYVDFNVQAVTQFAYEHEGKRGGDAVIDNCNIILLCLEEGCKGVKEIDRLLYSMFPKDRPRGKHITLCTVHKSKGLEADNVYMLDTERMPVDKDDEKNVGQEGNIMYVGITRAKERLYYVI